MSRIVTVTFNPANERRKVTAIKALRGLTGWGLKESKEFIDNVEIIGPNSLVIPDNIINPSVLSECTNNINNSGYTMTIFSPDTPVRRELNHQINAVMAYASLAGQHDVVRALTNVLETHLCFDATEENEDE